MLKVLIIDDESAEREGLRFLLQKFDYPFEIILEENGEAALDVLREQHCDLVISDIVMPRMDGLMFCSQARAIQPNLVIIIFSAYGDFHYTQSAIRIGVDDYILKPVIPDAFRNTIDRAIDLIHQKNGSSGESTMHFENSANHIIQNVKQLIQKHYSEPIGLEWIAARMYLSPGYLSSLFRQKTGRTVMQYLTLCRMRRACFLLTSTNIKITQIGLEIGYPNPSYFCFLFKKIFDITPNQLREGVSPHVMEKVQAILE